MLSQIQLLILQVLEGTQILRLKQETKTAFSSSKTRNRNRLQINTVIHEHEEEVKGTIDFRNRNRLREEEKGARFHTQREENKHQRDESIDRLIQENNVDNFNDGMNEVDANNESRNNERNEFDREESKNNQVNTQENVEKNNFLIDIEERKRSISARGERGRIHSSEILEIQNHIMNSYQMHEEAEGRNHIPNIAWQSSGNRNRNDEEEIDELINDFSNEIERN